jgi:hypothetical protein
VFKGDSADMCGGKFPLVSMGGRANGQACADGEQGPPSARAEILLTYLLNYLYSFIAGSSSNSGMSPLESANIAGNSITLLPPITFS